MTRVLNKVAIVTGGSSGIGRGCAIRLAEEGAKVAVTDIDPDMGAQTVDLITNAGGAAQFFPHDVTREDDWQRVVEQVTETWGDLNILVNNAAINPTFGPLAETELSAFDKIMQVLPITLQGFKIEGFEWNSNITMDNVLKHIKLRQNYLKGLDLTG